MHRWPWSARCGPRCRRWPHWGNPGSGVQDPRVSSRRLFCHARTGNGGHEHLRFTDDPPKCDTRQAALTPCPSPGRKTATAAARARRRQSFPGCPAGPAALRPRLPRMRSSIPRSPARNTGRSSRPASTHVYDAPNTADWSQQRHAGLAGCLPRSLDRPRRHGVAWLADRPATQPREEMNARRTRCGSNTRSLEL